MSDTISALLERQQVPCPVAHYFGDGVYVREITIPAGVLAVGRYHVYPHLNIMMRGKLITYNGDEAVELVAPTIFTSPPGRKFGFAVETTVWLNVFATTETDVAKIEEKFFVDNWLIPKDIEERNKDIQDFNSRFKAAPYNKLPNITSIRRSSIHGYGVFLSATVATGAVIDTVVYNGRSTGPLLSYLNHSASPNCVINYNHDESQAMLVAKEGIFGCVGGGDGTELTVDYSLTPELFGVEEKGK